MDGQKSDQLTSLLRKWNQGDVQAMEELMPLVYGDLRRVARQCLRREDPDHFIYTRTLVHEAYLRLIDGNKLQWQDRNHFLAVAAIVMRRVLVDEARKRKSLKRHGDARAAPLDEETPVSPIQNRQIIDLHEALERLELQFPRKCRIVELRYFAGLTIEETAETLGISVDIVKREWRTAKLWLQHELQAAKIPDGPDPSSAN